MLAARREKEMVERPWHRKKELVKSNEKVSSEPAHSLPSGSGRTHCQRNGWVVRVWGGSEGEIDMKSFHELIHM